MHASNFEILVAAVLIIPTCLGLWRDGKARTRVIQHLLERRRADRRLGKRPLHDPRANYHYLGAIQPGQVGLDPITQAFDRRIGERRSEDAAYQSTPVKPQTRTRVFDTRNTKSKINPSGLQAAHFHAKYTSVPSSAKSLDQP